MLFGRHSTLAGRLIERAMALVMSVTPLTLAAQGRAAIVEYDVEFSVQASPLDNQCPLTGSDVLKGTLVGYEPLPRDATRAYVGTLLRSTGVSTCSSRRVSGIDVVCSMSITGDGAVEVILEIEAGQAEGYLKYIHDRAQFASLLALRPRPPGPLRAVGSPDAPGCPPPGMARRRGHQ